MLNHAIAAQLNAKSVVLDGEIVSLDSSDHVEAESEGLFRLAWEYDLGGIVAKHKYAP